MEHMRIGKLNNADLERLVLSKFRSRRKEVLVAPGIGLDCALVDLGGDLCAVSSDPITGAVEKMGALAVHVCCNDAAAAGAEPVGILTTLLLPPTADDATIEAIAADVAQAAKIARVDVLGGHTECTDAVTRPVIAATVLARAQRGVRINAAQMQVGDVLFMTKWAALEASFVIAMDHPARLDGLLSEGEWRELAGWVDELSVVREAALAARCGVRAMHDATEGGILGACWEMAEASGVGLALTEKDIPVRDETRKICDALGLDVLRLMTSGVLLFAGKDEARIEQVFAQSDIALAKIGVVVPRDEGVCCDGLRVPPPEADELYRLFM